MKTIWNVKVHLKTDLLLIEKTYHVDSWQEFDRLRTISNLNPGKFEIKGFSVDHVMNAKEVNAEISKEIESCNAFA